MEKYIHTPCAFLAIGMYFNDTFVGTKTVYNSTPKICRLWKKGQFCPECNICFGREGAGDRGTELFDEKTKEVEYAFCWVCSRQHHSKCMGSVPRFICQACQRKTQEKCVGLAGNVTSISTEMSAGANNSLATINNFNTSVNYGTPTTSLSGSQRPRRLGVNQ